MRRKGYHQRAYGLIAHLIAHFGEEAARSKVLGLSILPAEYQMAHVIKLAKGVKLIDGLSGVVENPLNLKFVELEPALLPRALDDVKASIINANYALQAGFNPAKDAIALEAKSSPFGNIVAVRKGDAQKEAFQKLKKAITSPEVKKFIEDKYQGGVIPTF